MDDDREIWKRLIYANKAKHIEDFKTIEDNYNKNYEASIQFLKRISDNRRIPADQNKTLYERGNHDIPILEKSIFDIDSMLGDSDQDKDKNDYSGNQQSFDRIAHFLKIQKEKMEGKEDHNKIKEDNKKLSDTIPKNLCFFIISSPLWQYLASILFGRKQIKSRKEAS